MTTQGKSKALDEAPLEMIREIQGIHPEVNLQIRRQNSRGQWSTVGSRLRKATAELGDLESWISQHAGGGKFIVRVTSPTDPLTEVLPPFFVEIEGMPRQPTWQTEGDGAVPGAYYGAGAPPPPGAPPYAANGMPIPQQQPRPVAPSGWAMGLAPGQQAAYFAGVPSPYPQQPQGPYPGYDPGHRMDRPLNRYTSDELAKQSNDRLEKEIAQVRAEADRDRREYQAKLESQAKEYQARIDILLDKLEDERRSSRDREFESKILALRAEMGASTKPQPSMIDNIIALTPLLQTYLTGGQSQNQKMLELMLMKPKEDNGTLAMLEKLAPFLSPLLVKLLDGRGPEAQIKLIEQMGEQNLTYLGMAAQLIQSQLDSEAEADSAKGKLVPVLEQILGGAMQLGQAWLQGKQLDDLETLPPELRKHKLMQMGMDPESIAEIERGITLKQQAARARAVPVQKLIQTATAQTPPQAPAAAPAEVVHKAEVVNEEFTPDEQERIRKADRMVQLQLKNPAVPAEFKTPDWSRILVLIHAQLDVTAVAEDLAEHLDQLAEADAMPAVLAEFHEAPRATLAKVLLFLPIQQQNPAYVKSLLDAVDALYTDDEAAAAPNGGGTTPVPVPNFEEAQIPVGKS